MKQTAAQHASAREAGLVLVAGLLLTILTVLHLNASGQTSLPDFVGDRSDAIFDLWSIQHFLSGILVGSILAYVRIDLSASWHGFALRMFIFAFIWEAAELTMEAGWLGTSVAAWKKGYEHWGNRFIGDLLMVTLGGLLAGKYRNAWKWALMPAAVWFIGNVLSPHSMWVQEYLFGR